ncbi:FAD-dependent oxidoreductase [Exiguobacterium flavidum]|uniref:FAD-dependent oxidoreductase n=1 Tax=Exiguobacterium flavidum TaxID=2184695 RepID=UPI000DF7A585|nr:FAD-dependent oxidoreductase [Exiguobacterium flavidum]
MKTIVLVGAGHAHLHCIRHAESIPSVKWLVVTASRHQYYSGMFSGFAEGIYDSEDIRIDVRKLCAASGVEFIEDTAVSVDLKKKELVCASDRIVPYDAISFNLGSLDTPAIDGVFAHQLSIKPNYQAEERIKRFSTASNPVIVGSGAAAVEMAASFAARGMRLTLVHDGPLLKVNGIEATRLAEERLRELGVMTIHDRLVAALPEELLLESGNGITCDALLFLGGATAPPLFKDSSLWTDDSGFLLVMDTLQSLSSPSLFGAGDSATLASHPSTPKNGVTAVRQGPVLFRNLVAYLEDDLMLAYRPQRYYLTILSMGRRRGLLLYGKFVRFSRIAWLLKHRIDHRFMQKYRT